jgi:hypothetical protein
MFALKVVVIVAVLVIAFVLVARVFVTYVWNEEGKKTYYSGIITDISMDGYYVTIVTPSDKIILQRSTLCKLKEFHFVPGGYVVITDNKGRFKNLEPVKSST